MADITRIEKIEAELKACRADVQQASEKMDEILGMVGLIYRESCSISGHLLRGDPPVMMAGDGGLK